MELPFGFQFEESLFEEGRREQKGLSSLPLAYRARRCEPKWFCEEMKNEDDGENVNIKKFRGDLAYKQQEFKKALLDYSSCLVLLPPSNIAMRRDVQESQARCLAHLGRYKEALEIAELLQKGATNTDHVTSVVGLQLAVYRALERIEKMIGCLQQLISLHPFHPGNWTLLAEAYTSYLHHPPPMSVSEAELQGCENLTISNCLQVSLDNAIFQDHKKHNWRTGFPLQFSPKTNSSFGACEKCQTVEESIRAQGKLEAQHEVRNTTFSSMGQDGLEDMWIYACASWVRARLLLQLVQSQQSSFALESNLKAQQEIGDQVTSLGLNGDVLLLMTEAMGEDLVPEKLKEDAQGEVKCIGASALTSMMTASATEFERKWFQKLKDNLSHVHRCP